MAVEDTIVRHFLRARLIGGLVANRAYDTVIPPPAPPATAVTYPVIVWAMQSATAARLNGPVRAQVTMRYLVRGIAQSATYDDVDPIAEWIDAQIDRAAHVPVTRGGQPIGTIISCVLDQPWRLAEAPNNVAYRHLGGIYRLLVIKA